MYVHCAPPVTTPKMQNQPDGWIKDVLEIYRGIVCICIPFSASSRGTRGHYVKWNTTYRKRQIPLVSLIEIITEITVIKLISR